MSTDMCQPVERVIVTKLVDCLISAGMGVGILSFDNDDDAIGPFRKAKDILCHLFQCDEEWISAWKGERHVGSIQLVYGNDGWDVICDDTNPDLFGPILAPVTDFVEREDIGSEVLALINAAKALAATGRQEELHKALRAFGYLNREDD